MLLPPDLRDWIANDDLAHFILDAVEQLDLTAASLNVRGSGSDQYPPGMMLAVLIYCYASGIQSARRIEAATYQHLSVRYLSGNTHPDHDTIAKFRRENAPLLHSAFVQVLLMAKELKLLRLGTISIDGTKIRASASQNANRKVTALAEELAVTAEQVDRLLEQAEQADSNDTEDGSRLPAELSERRTRLARLQAARQRLQEQSRERAAERAAERESGSDQPGRPPEAKSTEPQASDRVNVTDPDSRLMKTNKEGYVQGYNAQLAVSVESGLIVGTRVSREPCDRRELLSTVSCIPAAIGVAANVLADSGYDNQRQIAAVERPGKTMVFCAPCGENKQGAGGSARGQRRLTVEARARMRARLESATGRALYRLRAMTVEPVIGIVKSVLGCRQFRRRGLAAVEAEWQLVALAFNCRKLARVMS